MAAVNGPYSVVVSGDEDAVLELRVVAGAGRKTKRLQVSHAFHSHRMDGMLDEFARRSENLLPAPRIPIVSNLAGELASGANLHGRYWVRHVREPVRFPDGMRWLEARSRELPGAGSRRRAQRDGPGLSR